MGTQRGRAADGGCPSVQVGRNFVATLESHDGDLFRRGRDMEPGNNKPSSDESKGREPNFSTAEGTEAKVVDTKIAQPGVHLSMNERRITQVSRRELLRVAPVL